MFRSIQPHSNPFRLTQSCSRFSLIPTDSFRFTQIHSDLLRLAQTSSNWNILKGKGKWSRDQKGKGKALNPPFHPWFDMNNTARRTHGRDETTSRLGCSVLADSLPPNLRTITTCCDSSGSWHYKHAHRKRNSMLSTSCLLYTSPSPRD